jgi:tripartite-type tricarboxylate transporter receptor subunit TctC
MWEESRMFKNLVRVRWAAVFLVGSAVCALAPPSLAQDYPSKPVRIVVPFAAGGRADALARIVGRGLQDELGRPFVVENRAGASGSLGADFVAKSPADGYVLLMTSSGVQAILPKISKSLPYDIDRDFTPVAMVVESYSFVGVHPAVPARTIREFVDFAGRNAGRMNFASSGVGTYNHFAGEFFNIGAGTKIAHIAYRGSGPSVTDLVAGHVQMMIGGEFIEQAAAGNVRILATTNEKRWPGLADVPTMREAGFPDFRLPPLWFGLLGPGGMPRPIVERLNAATAKVIANPAVVKLIEAQGSVGKPMSPEAFATQIRAEQEAYGAVAASAGMKFEN